MRTAPRAWGRKTQPLRDTIARRVNHTARKEGMNPGARFRREAS